MATKTFDVVIIGFDRSEQAMDALALGRLLKSLESSRLSLAYVVDQQPPFVRQTRSYGQARHDQVQNVLGPGVEALGPDQVEAISIDSSSPARGLHDLAAEHSKYGAPVLVIGSTHRGPVGRVLPGSVGELLLAGAPCPVIVAPRDYGKRAPSAFTRIVVGFDGSREAHVALKAGHALAQAARATLDAVAVVHHAVFGRHDAEGAAPNDRAALEASLEQALAGLGDTVGGEVVEGDPANQLAKAAIGADILVLGGRGYGPRHHVLTGSVSSKLMRSAPSPVLIMPRSGADRAGA